MQDDKFKVEKSNVLNAFRCNAHEIMSVNELRFFCLYVSRLNPREENTRTIEIKIQDFENLFNVKLNTTDFTKTIDKIIDRKMYIYNTEENSNEVIHLYSKFKWYNDDVKDTISVTANSDIMPYLFNLTSNYTSYKIGNIAKLNTVSKIRLYEILCQYRKLKEITFEIEKLQQLMMTNYAQFKYFNEKALTPAIKDINEYTDITVVYEKVTRGRKCIALKFYIESKEQPKTIECAETVKEVETVPKWNGFTSEQEDELYDYIRRELKNIYKSAKMLHNRTETIYSNALTELKKRSDIKHHKAYIKKIIDTLIAEEQKKPQKEGKIRSYDINQFEKFAINYPELQKVENGEVSESHSEPVLEPVKETKVICQGEVEKPVIEPVNAENEDTEKMFEETEEGIALFTKILTALNKFQDYDVSIEILDLINRDWRKYEGFCKTLIMDKLQKKENAPEIIDVFENK